MAFGRWFDPVPRFIAVVLQTIFSHRLAIRGRCGLGYNQRRLKTLEVCRHGGRLWVSANMPHAAISQFTVPTS
jgi:hypothetical protein